ncbi:hypothetical protein C8D77_11185 [Mesorhizobium loti]|uniref:Putative DnaT-like domain-containing protein n=1 Tax=Rhizobium loti TaxID=381 RepID=A0A8E2WAJ3_RHILI|nr:DnaT-like ssDNA-binding protein [Mesorhizobium loti]PWJ88363.1 hypothetical protein C8D77_11185 [Mesorhizobium loti]
MALVVEDGTGLAGANSYVSVADFEAYLDSRATALPSGDEEGALIRATDFIDGEYRLRFPGKRLLGRTQALEWPRKEAVDQFGEDIDDDEVPVEIKNATCEAAVRELADPGSLSPDLERGGKIKELKAGSVDITYTDGAPAETIFSIIDKALSGIIGKRSTTSSSFFLRA